MFCFFLKRQKKILLKNDSRTRGEFCSLWCFSSISMVNMNSLYAFNIGLHSMHSLNAFTIYIDYIHSLYAFTLCTLFTQFTLFTISTLFTLFTIFTWFSLRALRALRARLSQICISRDAHPKRLHLKNRSPNIISNRPGVAGAFL